MGRREVAVIVSMWVIPMSILVNRIVPHPYMDEIFHVPQAQQYCKGNLGNWDPMITTPPGLYFVSLAHVASLFPGMYSIQVTTSFSGACSVAILRSTNAVLAIICSVLIYEIITRLRPNLDDRRATLCAVVLALFPLHWFFTFLYYTDVASLAAVLAMYLASINKSYIFSALLGALSVFMRQTNIIWVVFVAGIGVVEHTLPHKKAKVTRDDLDALMGMASQITSNKDAVKGSSLRKRKPDSRARTVNHSAQRRFSSETFSSGFLDEIRDIVPVAWHLKWELLALLTPFSIVLVAFVAFVYWNGSVVLGAKEAHTVSSHFAQLMYFSIVSALFMAPLHFNLAHVSALLRSCWKNKSLSFFQLFVAVTASLFSVHYFSIAHPYLLADNRHYPFYIWRKVINAHFAMKYLLVPVYVYSWFSIFSILGKSQKKTWILLYFLACAAVLIPTPLIEFRYYTIPFFFFALHSHIDNYRSWVLTGIVYVAINLFTMYMFLFRPFHWNHEPGIQRFIW